MPYGPYSQYSIIFLIHEWAQYARLLHHTGLERLSSDKHSSLLDLTCCEPVLSYSGNTKGGSIIVLLTSCLTGLDKSVLQIKTKIFSCHTADSKSVKQWPVL